MGKKNRHEDSEVLNYFNLTKYIRVLELASTPDLQEFIDVAKIVSAGVVVVGLLGYLIFVLMSFLPM